MKNSARKNPAPRRRRSSQATILHELGARIRERRQANGVTQQTLAAELRLSVAYVSLIERGARNPPYTRVVAIAEALGVPASELTG